MSNNEKTKSLPRDQKEDKDKPKKDKKSANKEPAPKDEPKVMKSSAFEVIGRIGYKS